MHAGTHMHMNKHVLWGRKLMGDCPWMQYWPLSVQGFSHNISINFCSWFEDGLWENNGKNKNQQTLTLLLLYIFFYFLLFYTFHYLPLRDIFRSDPIFLSCIFLSSDIHNLWKSPDQYCCVSLICYANRLKAHQIVLFIKLCESPGWWWRQKITTLFIKESGWYSYCTDSSASAPMGETIPNICTQ